MRGRVEGGGEGGGGGGGEGGEGAGGGGVGGRNRFLASHQGGISKAPVGRQWAKEAGIHMFSNNSFSPCLL